MAITQAMCTSFKVELLTGTHDFTNSTGDSFKLALYTSSASLGASTTAYTASNEASGTGYSAGGQTLDSGTISTSGTTAFVDFADEVFSDVTLSADGCIIYNSSASNKAIATIDFGGTVSATAGDLTIEFPAAGASTAIIRIA